MRAPAGGAEDRKHRVMGWTDINSQPVPKFTHCCYQQPWFFFSCLFFFFFGRCITFHCLKTPHTFHPLYHTWALSLFLAIIVNSSWEHSYFSWTCLKKKNYYIRGLWIFNMRWWHEAIFQSTCTDLHSLCTSHPF